MTRGGPLGAGRLIATALCLVAVGLRLRDLGGLPLWTDEAFTWANVNEPLARLLGAQLNVHPPLYFLVERYWIRLVGDGEYALRAANALGSVVAVAALAQLGRRLSRPGGGLVAAALVAVAPTAVAYGREARMYGVLIAGAAVLLVLADRAAARPSSGRWALYGAVAVAVGMTHYTGLAAVAAGGLWTMPNRRACLRRWAVVHIAVLALLGAWGLHFWANRDAWAGLVWLPWATPVRLDQQVVDWATSLGGVALGPTGLGDALRDRPRALLLVVPLLAAAAIGALALIRRRPRAALALLLLGVGPLAAIVLLEPVRPMWHVRFTLVGLPALFALAGAGVAALGRRPAGTLALAALVAAPQIVGLATTPPDTREDWRAVARALQPRLAPGDVVLAGLDVMARYYLRGPNRVAQRPVALGQPIDEVAGQLNQAVGAAQVVWLAPSEDPLLDPANLVGAMLERYADKRDQPTMAGVHLTRLELRPHGTIAASPPMTPLATAFGGAIRLLDYNAERLNLGGERSVRLSLDARVDRPVDRDYKLFAHLLDERGQTVAQRDVFPLDGERRPTSRMDAGTVFRIEVAVAGPADRIDAGRSVGIGFYDEKSGERLALEPTAPENRLVLPISGS